MKKRLKKGFTLVELVVVIAIIAILSAVSVAGYFGFTTKARKTAVKSEASELANLVLVVSADDDTILTNDGSTIKIARGDEVRGTDVALLTTVLNSAGWTLPEGATLAEPSTATADDDIIESLIYTRAGYSYTITVGTGAVTATTAA